MANAFYFYMKQIQIKTISLKKSSSREHLKTLEQTGKFKDLARDFSRKALMPGKRISKSGKIYWETRRNRSDNPKTRI